MFKKYVYPRKKDISITMFIKIFSTFCGIMVPAILAYIIDTVVPTKNKTMIVLVGLLMILVSFLEWFYSIKSNRMASKISSDTIQDIRQDLFERSIRLSAKQIDKLGISSIESRLTSDTYTIHNFLGTAMRMGARSVILFLGGIIFCIILSPRLSIVILILVIPIFATIRFIYNKTQPMWKNLQNRVDVMVQSIRESIRGIKVAKALNKVEYEKNKFFNANNSVREQNIEATDIMALTSPLVNTLLYIGLAVVIIYGGNLVKNNQIKLGTIIAFMTYFIQITHSLFMLNWMFNIYSRAMTSVKRIEEVIFMPIDKNQIVDNPTKLPKSNSDIPEIEFKNVSFSYHGTENSLVNINFKLFVGEKLGIMGATGSGKSTIIKLLLRQYDVSEGEILIRGVNIKNINHRDLNAIYGSVFQKDFLFKGTIKENIDFGRNLLDEELIDATINAQAQEFIEEKEDKLDHALASKGVNLSGGQKQRVLLSRAFASKPEILVLDDSSSALDFKTESNLRRAIDDNFGNSTTIIIAQRISSVISANQILFLENGKILAKGNHEYMINNCIPYREIADMQIGEMK
ncbi:MULTISPECIES: ABC transporter ATP-binding protein [Helcococcus]|uniref:ABC transporter ATP-binding protein n=1 Tax=Helcococcus bovis TaxID=3153252 RepID=A0ABW9F4K4_9FIRM